MNVRIHPTAILEQPYRNFQGNKEIYDLEYKSTEIADSVSIGPGAVIGKGVKLSDGVVIDSQCIVEPNASIGANCLFINHIHCAQHVAGVSEAHNA